MDFGDFDLFGENISKTSPIRKPQLDFDFDFNDSGLQSPTSVPNFSNIQSINPRTVDSKSDLLTLDDLMYNYEHMNSVNTRISSLKKPLKKIPIILRPFISIDATELTVNQLRASFAREKQNKDIVL